MLKKNKLFKLSISSLKNNNQRKKFNYSKIYLDFANQFHHNGFFADTPMNELEVKNFLKKHSQSFDYLAVEHIKKLEEHELKTKY